MPVQFPGYTVSNLIYRCETTSVYRAVRQADNLPVIIRGCTAPHPSLATVSRIRFIAELLPRFDHPNIVKLLEWGDNNTRPYIVMEDINGITLTEYLGNNLQQLLSIDRFIQLAIQLAEALSVIHHAQIIHKHLHTDNLIINPDTGQVQIIDFGFSSLLNREQPSIAAPENLEGNLAYLSPEQTGRMNRVLDYRSDFYTLGVMFYQCLTGQLPFIDDDALGIIYSHLAKQPEPITNTRSDIPNAICQIIGKLMRKNAEDRYQSAIGLKHDLLFCQNHLEDSHKLETLTLGTKDVSDRLQIPQKLYGRRKEMGRLMDLFEQMINGQPRCFAIGGYSGIGKSALVHEMHKPIAAKDGLFISGKFDQFQQNIPYSALKIALKKGLSQILSRPTELITQLRESLIEAIGTNARVLIDFMPEFGSLLGELAPVPEFGSLESRARFHMALQGFVKTLSQQHPLVMFFDDLQWADPGTLKLLPELLAEPGGRLLIIVAYRDNEVDMHHPARDCLAQISQIDTIHPLLSKIKLAPLPETEILQLLKDSLKLDKASAAPLASLVYKKTQGNPFFTLEFLKTLYEKNLLAFSLKSHQWQWNLEAIKAESIADNVVDLMVRKMSLLPKQTQHLIHIAACIGSRFDLVTLALAAEQTIADCAQFLWPALQDGLLIQEGGDWLVGMSAQSSALSHLPDANGRETGEDNLNWVPSCKFIHDRMLQAATELLPESERRKTHLNIGRMLYQHTDESERESKVFDLVGQLNNGMLLIDNPEEKKSLAQLNLLAANKAKQASVWSAAVNYAQTAQQLFAQLDDPKNEPLSLQLLSILAECEYLLGNIEAAEQHYEALLEKTSSKEDKAEQCAHRLVQYIGRAEYDKALVNGLLGLSLLNVDLPQGEQALKQLGEQQSKQLHKYFKQTPIDQLHLLPEVKDLKQPIIISLSTNIAVIGLLTKQDDLSHVGIQEAMLRSFTHGQCDLLAQTLAVYCLMLNGLGDFELAYKAGQEALVILDLNPNCRGAASTLNGVAQGSSHLKAPLKKSIEIFSRGYETGLRNGELARAAICKANILLVKMVDGSRLDEIVTEAEQCITFAKNKNLQVMLSYILKQYGLTLRDNKNHLTPEYFTEQTYHTIQSSFFISFLNICQFCFSFWSDASLKTRKSLLKQTIKTYSYIKNIVGTYDFYGFICLTILQSKRSKEFEQLSIEEQEYWANQFHEFHKKLQALNTCYPPNHQHKLTLIEAEQAALDNCPIETCVKLYQAAIEHANKNRFRHYVALANEYYGEFLIERGFPELGESRLREAFSVYQDWGCQPKIDRFKQRYDFLNIDQTDDAKTPKSPTLNAALDYTSILKATRAISGEVALQELANRVVSVTMENVGAQKGAFVLKTPHGPSVEALVCANQPVSPSQVGKQLKQHRDLPASLINYVLRTNEAITIDDITNDVRFNKDPYIVDTQPKSLLCLPVTYREETIGAIYLENSLTKCAFTKDRIETIHFLLSQAAIAYENARLFQEVNQLNTGLEKKVESRAQQLAASLKIQQALNEDIGRKSNDLTAANEQLTLLATTDSLTGAYNRRHFLVLMKKELTRAARYRHTTVALMLDIDFFKKVNDTYGHAAGDEALRRVSDVCQKSLRQQDVFGRLGGEEFAILLPETDREGALMIAERVRTQVAKLTILSDANEIKSTDFKVTLSIGLADTIDPNISPETLLQRADNALYEAKENGRNQVVIA